MNKRAVYCAGSTAAAGYAREYLKASRVPVADSCNWDVGHLLLDVPSFTPGRTVALDTILAS